VRALGCFLGVFFATLALLACTIMNDRRLPARPPGAGLDGGERDSRPADASPPEDSGTLACSSDTPFEDPRPIRELNTIEDEAQPRLSADERTIFYYRYDGDAGGSLYQAKRDTADGAFTPPTRLFPGLPGARMPSLSADGLRLYFTAGLSTTGLSIHLSERASTDQPFVSERVILPFTADDSFLGPQLYEGPGGPVLYLTRNLFDDDDVIRANLDPRGGIVATTLAEVPEVNTDAHEFDPFLSPDGLALYFTSEREGTPSGGRIFVARRPTPTSAFGPPQPLAEIAQPAGGWVGMGSLSPDNCRLYYYSSTNGIECDLYVARRPR
jgi:hypothetical protein